MDSGQPNQTRLAEDAKDEFLSLLASVKEDIVSPDQRNADLNKVYGYSQHLTLREREVLRLVALGMNNTEIAQELFISLNTVTRHMTNIFSKTGTTNRVEAALYAARHGIS